jgi:trimeric autotransporter adhesin
MTTRPLKESISRSPLRRGLLLIPLLLACFALLPKAQAEEVTPQLALPGFNTADGFNALDSLTTGIFNSAFGALTLEDTTTGSHNTGLGAQALRNNTLGSYNTAVGENALVFNTTGNQNMALGQGALANNLTGSNNVAMGFQALNKNDTVQNVAVGTQALFSNTTGVQNTALGTQALFSNTTAGANSTGANTAVGFAALALNTIGGANTAIGYGALFANTGGGNIALGDLAGVDLTTGNSNICIGARGHAGESGFIRIANNSVQVGGTNSKVFVGGIFGATIGGAATIVGVNANGQLGTAVSSARYKTDIESMGKSSESIFSLRPVTFHYKGDETNLPCFGLIAEEVAKSNPDLILLDKEGKPLTVRYEQINAMLLNEFLKEHTEVQELKKQVAALTAGLQKVSAQLEMNKPAPRTVSNQ